MKRTIALKLNLTQEQSLSLLGTQQAFSNGCNHIASLALENRCWNQVKLHHLCYYQVREKTEMLGAQMVCNAIRKVCASYKVLKIKKSQEVPAIKFKETSSIHYCARTFTLKNETLSLFTIHGRIKCQYQMGPHQEYYLAVGKIKEGELIRKGKRWFFHLVLDIPDVKPLTEGNVMAVDMGENNLATTSNNTIHGGRKLRHKRDVYLARRKKLQSNGSRSAKRKLQKISGKERRYVKETNHLVSKSIVQEAMKTGIQMIIMEDLTHIRKRMKAGKRMRCRLHRWSWHELQTFIEYKAQAQGIRLQYVNPAYTSLTCSKCQSLGERHKHQFKCFSCGSYQHSDRNACQNLCKLAGSVVPAMVSVNMPMVATACR
jgi:IS605 OrfB family transposase